MKSFTGYLKRALDDSYILLANGGEKPISDFLLSSGGTLTGPIYFGKAGVEANILCYNASYPNYGIHYFDDTVDKLTLSASGNANSISGADLCINGNGDGTVTIRGKSILHSGGGTLSGIITRDAGGEWIKARDNVIIKTTRTSSEGHDWHPAVGIKTSSGFWSFGSVGGEHLGFSYDTDANYSSNSNNNIRIDIPGKAGTIALTSDIPITGTTFNSGDNSNHTHNCNDAWQNGHYYYNANGPSGLGNSTSDGALYVLNYSSSWVGQIAQDYRNGRLFMRGKNNGSWTSWMANLDSGNYSSYALPLSGGTMTGLIYFNQYGLGTTYIGHANESWMHFLSPVNFYFSTNVHINGSAVPYSNGGGSLGGSSNKWANLYLSSRMYTDEWIQFSGSTGLYWPNTYGCHFYPAVDCSYGSFQVRGTKNSYMGITAGDSDTYPTFMGHSTHLGLYNTSKGRWIIYYNRDNDRTGIHTSSLAAYPITLGGSTYIGDWFRIGGNVGVYFESYGGGWYMTDSNFIRSYGSKPLHISVSNNTYGGGGHNTAIDCYNSAHSSIGLRNDNCGWWICSNSNRNFYFAYRPNGNASGYGSDSYPVYITPAGAIYTNSDRRLKKNILDILYKELEDLINNISLKKFTWKSSGKNSYGFIAQELKEIIPEAVDEDTDGIMHVSYNVAYAKIIASLIYKIKDLENRIKQLEN